MVELVALELEPRKSFKAVSFTGMKTGWGPAGRGRQVGAQEDEKRKRLSKIGLQWQPCKFDKKSQEGKKSDDEGEVSKTKGKIFRSRKAQRQELRQGCGKCSHYSQV